MKLLGANVGTFVHEVHRFARLCFTLLGSFCVTTTPALSATTNSVDGICQDFVGQDPPAGTGPLRLELALQGARAEVSPGAQLVLNESGRKLNYNRLRVTDTTGRELATV